MFAPDKHRRERNTHLLRLKLPAAGSNAPLSDETPAVRGAARAATSRLAHQLLRELAAPGLSIGRGQLGVGPQPPGGGRLGLLTEDCGETLGGEALPTLCPFVHRSHVCGGSEEPTVGEAASPSFGVSRTLLFT